MTNTNLMHARLERTEIKRNTKLDRTTFENADLHKANFIETQSTRINLRNSNLRRVDFSRATLTEPNLQDADLTRATLSATKVFRPSSMAGAKIIATTATNSRWIGTFAAPISLKNTDLRKSTFEGAAFQFVDFKGAIFDRTTDFRNAFFDGSVQLPRHIADQIDAKCQHPPAVLSQSDFLAHWLGWLTLNPDWEPAIWQRLVENEFHDLQPIAPPIGCLWQNTNHP
ncbi:MAG: pentapeptide repeat-containing protein [Sedimentitalea sp.]